MIGSFPTALKRYAVPLSSLACIIAICGPIIAAGHGHGVDKIAAGDAVVMIQIQHLAQSLSDDRAINNERHARTQIDRLRAISRRRALTQDEKDDLQMWIEQKKFWQEKLRVSRSV